MGPCADASLAKGTHLKKANHMKLLSLLAFTLLACNPSALETGAVSSQIDLGTVLTMTVPTGNSNNVVAYPFPGMLGVTSNAAGSTLTGIETNAPLDEFGNYIGPGVSGTHMMYVWNAGPGILTLAHNRTSEIFNRFRSWDGRDVILTPGRGVDLLYNSDYWMIKATTPPSPSISSIVSARTLNTAWQNTGTRAVLGMYSIRVLSGLTLVAGQTGHVELAIGATSGTINTMCGRTAGGNTGSIGVLTNNDVQEGQIVCLIVPGGWAKLTTVDEAGTPTYTLTAQLEQSI